MEIFNFYEFDQTKNALKSSENGHLYYKYRYQISKQFKDKNSINKLYFECAKKVFHIWYNIYKDEYIYELLEKSKQFIDGKIERDVLLNCADKYKNNIENCQEISAMNAGMASLHLAYYLVGDAISSLPYNDFNYSNQDDNDFDWEEWNTDYYASMAYSGGSPFLKEGSSELRKEFWLWYLETAKNIFNNAHYPVSINFLLPTNNKKETKIQRNSTKLTEEVKSKINVIIEVAVEQLKELGAQWDSFEIEANMVWLGGSCEGKFIKNDVKSRFMPCGFDMPNGRDPYILFNDIKKAMYKDSFGGGAWFIFILNVKKDVSYSYEIFYDLKSKNISDDDEYIEDFILYPRKKIFTPQWLQKILKKGKREDLYLQ